MFCILCLCHQDTACSDHILNTASGNVHSIPTDLGVIEGEGQACQEENVNGAICTIDKCVQCVFHSCANCLSYLCFDHLESDCTERGYCSKSVDMQNSRTVITDSAAIGSCDENSCETADDSETELDFTSKPSRKRKLNKEKWKKNVKRRLRNTGEKYLTKSGKTVAKRKWQPSQCLERKCPLKCHTRVSESCQSELFNYYWKELGNYNKQQDYLAAHIETTSTKCKTTENSRRKYTAKYFLTVSGERVRVCRDLFMRTLGETPDRLRYHREHKRDIHGGTTADGRGNHKRRTKIRDADKDRIRHHILSFPAVESHYCRSQSQRRYLSQELTISEMYRMYEKQCRDNNVKAQTESLYRQIFCTEFNYGFHHPKKDQCSVCNKFKLTKTEDEAFVLHQRRKEQARNMKEVDKQAAKNDASHCAVTFDLQKVLMCPAGKVGQIFYKRKFATYNLTVHDLANKNGYCYMWDESTGKRGSSEIASCLWKWMENLSPETKQLTLYSDACSGQNRNVYVMAMMLAGVKILPIQQIDHKFLESGHTQMEVDSMHACIERASKAVEVYLPRDWALIAATARKTGKPYTVTRMTNKEIFDFKAVASKLISNRNKADDGSCLNWMRIKWLRYVKGSDLVQIKMELDDSPFVTLNVRKNTRGRAVQSATVQSLLKPLFTAAVPIAKAKFNDLQDLCRTLVIPAECHYFYKGLVHSATVADSLEEPDVEEGSDDDESLH